MIGCEAVEAELVAYHFGLLDGPARDDVEKHLESCAECVRAFVGVKRAIEAPTGVAPSRAARERLRRAVAREVAPAAPRRWWERPLAFAVAASVVLAAGAATRAITSGPGAPPHGLTASDLR
jgi:anti-sigma factor RsiW